LSFSEKLFSPYVHKAQTIFPQLLVPHPILELFKKLRTEAGSLRSERRGVWQ